MNETIVEKAPGKGEVAGAIASASTGVAAAALTVVTAACCVSPVVAPIIVSVLGASGAVWAAGLKPYSWWILVGAFASGYAIARTAGEFFREPDAQLGFLWGGLTMGILLSIPLFLAGMAFMIFAVRHRTADRS